MNTLPYKGKAVILVKTDEDVQRVKNILKDINPDEFHYMWDDLIQVDSKFWEFGYVGKFEPDLDELKKRCDAAGILFDVREEQEEYFPSTEY